MGILAVDEVMLREPRLLVPRLQPVGPVKIDWSHPLSKRLAFAWIGGRNENLVNGRVADTRTAPTKIVNGNRCAACADNAFTCLIWNTEHIVTSDGAGTGDLTMIVRANPPSRNDIDSLFCQKYDAGGSPFGQIILAANMAIGGTAGAGRITLFTYNGSTTAAASETTQVTGEMRVFGGRRQAGALTVWVNGINATAAADAANARDISDGLRRTGIGYSGKADNSEGPDADIEFAFAWNRALSETEMRQVALDPYQFLIPA